MKRQSHIPPSPPTAAFLPISCPMGVLVPSAGRGPSSAAPRARRRRRGAATPRGAGRTKACHEPQRRSHSAARRMPEGLWLFCGSFYVFCVLFFFGGKVGVCQFLLLLFCLLLFFLVGGGGGGYCAMGSLEQNPSMSFWGEKSLSKKENRQFLGPPSLRQTHIETEKHNAIGCFRAPIPAQCRRGFRKRSFITYPVDLSGSNYMVCRITREGKSVQCTPQPVDILRVSL